MQPKTLLRWIIRNFCGVYNSVAIWSKGALDTIMQFIKHKHNATQNQRMAATVWLYSELHKSYFVCKLKNECIVSRDSNKNLNTKVITSWINRASENTSVVCVVNT